MFRVDGDGVWAFRLSLLGDFVFFSEGSKGIAFRGLIFVNSVFCAIFSKRMKPIQKKHKYETKTKRKNVFSFDNLLFLVV